MARYTAFLDACVLVPVAPCDTLLRMADLGLFRPVWSARVIDEARRALERIHPDIDPSRFRSRFRSMNEAFDDALVEGWEPLTQGLDLPDPDDRHVVAAALRGRADAIITENIRDFPDSTLKPIGLDAVRSDAFLLDQFDLDPSAALHIVVEQAAAMTRPPVDIETLLTRLARSGVPRFAQAVRELMLETRPGASRRA
ncbi:PIN domain-containing protein [Pseudactinotalea sp. HY158]|uniref:PIN domain-containing protein n=1 Tax=Pseudactinotalea sp. HY158 TaxID=2654547 RepID=UPI00129C2B31|nr:PIN domain-containing protein [Pseudactinotalea sp. HY158]QGH70793.1 PIN domain-containing protein [Pseudactinotalea sp. HY158]